MTFCSACGRQSRRDDACEWCRQPLGPGQTTGTPGTQPTMQMPVQTVRRVALTGEVVEATQAMPPQHYSGPQGAPGAYSAQPIPYSHAQSGPHSPMQPGPYPGRAVVTGAALPPSAYTAAAIKERTEAEAPPASQRWELAFAICLPILVLSMLLVHFVPTVMLGIVFGNLLLLPIILGATGAIPRYEDAILDCSVVLVIAIFLGPLIALGAYLLTAMVKQECNPAIVALLGINLLIKGLFGIAFAPVADTLTLIAMWGFLNWLSFFGVCLSFLGWLLSSFFRGVTG